MGCRGPTVRLPCSFLCPPITLSGSDTPSHLFSQLHQRDCVGCCSSRSPRERSSRTSSFGSGLLQPPICHPQGHRGLEASDRSLTPQPVGPSLPVSYGDSFVGSPISSSWDWMVSLDLQDAYLQVPVHPSSRHYLRFCVGDSVLQFRALCFGLSTAPQVFTRVMAPVSAIMHRYDFRILRYLDDWLVLGSSFQEIVRARDFLLWLCQELGVRVNLSKSSLDPAQTLDYLGMRLLMRPLKVFPTTKRVQKLSSLLLEFASCPQQPLSLWRQLLGVMSCRGLSCKCVPFSCASTPPAVF